MPHPDIVAGVASRSCYLSAGFIDCCCFLLLCVQRLYQMNASRRSTTTTLCEERISMPMSLWVSLGEGLCVASCSIVINDQSIYSSFAAQRLLHYFIQLPSPVQRSVSCVYMRFCPSYARMLVGPACMCHNVLPITKVSLYVV